MLLHRIGVKGGPFLGDATLDQVGPVLDLASAAVNGVDQVFGVEERGVGHFAPWEPPPGSFDGAEVRVARRELIDSELTLAQVRARVLPDHDEWAAELGVCGGDQQVAVVLPRPSVRRSGAGQQISFGCPPCLQQLSVVPDRCRQR